jgi:phosphatidylethanolamine-binding protein (PEBP) family uncharacterized protein
MFQLLPYSVGRLFRRIRPGLEKITYHDPFFINAPETIRLTSPAFRDGGRIPLQYTCDGKGISPPLEWMGIPPKARSLVLIIEDADSPACEPRTHAVITGLPGMDDHIPSAAFRNLGARYLAPDPPPGHGPHRYVFQIFALDTLLHLLSEAPLKNAVKEAMRRDVVAKGCLMGIYERSRKNGRKPASPSRNPKRPDF